MTDKQGGTTSWAQPRTDGSVRVTREQLIDLLNDDLAREYQSIIAYVVYSQVLKGAAFMSIAEELEKHAKQELEHALTIAQQIDYLGGMPTVWPKEVKTSGSVSTSTMKMKRCITIGCACASARRWVSSLSPSTFARSSSTSRSIRSIWPRPLAKTSPKWLPPKTWRSGNCGPACER